VMGSFVLTSNTSPRLRGAALLSRGRGESINNSTVHPSTEPGQLHIGSWMR
jgi:hypothetical protein